MHFNNKNIRPGEIEIDLNGCKIKSSPSARFLGIIFDYRHSFSTHIDHVFTKCQRALNILKFLCGITWGSDPETLIIFFKSYIRSIIDYSSFIYFPRNINLIEKIERIQYQAIRCALGYRKTTPTNVIMAEAKLDYIQLRAKYLGDCFFAKTLSNEGSLTAQTIKEHLIHTMKRLRKNTSVFDTCLASTNEYLPVIMRDDKYIIYNHNYKTLITTIPRTSLFDDRKKCKDPDEAINKLLSQKNAHAIYTDGSKVKGNNYTGSACICPDLDICIQRSLNRETSVYTAECIALDDAFEIAANQRDKKFLIFSDSLSALQSLQSTKLKITTNAYIYNIKNKYNTLINNTLDTPQVEIVWIPRTWESAETRKLTNLRK